MNSGTMWASVVSMLSMRSISVFFSAPELCASTAPRGMRVSFSVQRLRISPSTAKVARWLVAVEKAWHSTRPSHISAISPA